MVEPIGLLGTGVGIVSLGLQLYGELKKYVDSYTGREEQLSKALASIEILHQSLNAIRDVLPDFDSEQRVTNDVVRSCLQSCKDDMLLLQTELRKHEALPYTDLNGRFREVKKKLQYPFSQNALVELNSRLERILASLYLAIDGLELSSLSSIDTKVTGLTMAAQSHSTVLAELKSNVSALEAAHSNTNTHLIDVHKGTEPLCRKIDDLEMRVSAHFLNLENQVQADQVDKGRRLDTLESLMGSFVLQFSDGRPPSTSTSVERRLIGTLVSKPSLLKDIHDTVDSVPYESHEMVHQKPKDPWSGYLRAVPPEIDPWYQITCICKPQQTVQRFSTRWPSFTFTSTTVIKSKHHSTCPLHKAVRRKRKQQYEVTFTGLRNLLNTAVTAGFSLSFGAGGCSIAPSFQYFAMVDEAQSPAFRIIGEVATVMGGWHSELNEKTINAVLVHALSRLNAIYIKRTASPSDVNHAGETVMDALFTKVGHHITSPLWRSGFWEYNLKTTSALSQLNVPSKHQHNNNCFFAFKVEQPSTASSCIKNINDFYGIVCEVVSTLIKSAPECNYQWNIDQFDLLRQRSLVCAIDKATEVFGLDSLSTIVLRQDEESLRRTLLAKPVFLADLHNYRFKWALFSLAVQWPAGLKALLDVEPTILTSRDGDFSYSLLHVAARWSSMICTGKFIRPMCNDCYCSETVEILLNRNCYFSESDSRRILGKGQSCSRKVVFGLLQHLKEWRKRLQDTLHTFLPEKYQPATSCSTLLDYGAPAAIADLEEVGVSPYTLYGLERGDYRLGPRPGATEPQSTIFDHILTADVAQKAFDLGFRDIDVVSEGSTPLGKLLTRDDRPCHRGYCEWLIRHGADYSRETPRIGRKNVVGVLSCPLIHALARELVGPLCFWPFDKSNQSWWLSFFGNLTISDGCKCACSPKGRGCYPLTILFNRCIRQGNWRSPSNSTRQLILHLSKDNTSLTLAESILQCLTFSRLGIRHTCCEFEMDDAQENDRLDELECLRAEDAERVELLNRLVAEFMEQYHREGVSLSSYITGPWWERMDMIEAEEENAQWSAEERNALLSIGVIPHDEDTDEMEETESEAGSESSVESVDVYQAEFWIRRIDRIAGV